MRSSVLISAILVLTFVSSQPSMRAGEPDGFVRITPVWRSEGESLTLRIDPVVDIAEARLVVTVPESVTVDRKQHGASFRSVESRPGTRRLVLDLAPSLSALTLELDLEVPPGRVGVASFVVEGRTLSGRAFSEGVGVGLGSSRGNLVRDGAIEYPAATTGGDR